MSLSKLLEMVKDRKAVHGVWYTAVHGGHKELDTTEWLNNNKMIPLLLIKVFQGQGLEVIGMIWLLLPLTSYHKLFAQLSSRPTAFLQKTKLCSDLGTVNFYAFSRS